LPPTSSALPALDEAALTQAVKKLAAAEPHFQAVVDRHGLPPLRLVDNSLESLLRIVTEQLISLKAAAVIWQRLHMLLHPFEPAAIRATSIEKLKSAGLSTAKARCFVTLAEWHDEGRLDLQALAEADDEAARGRLLELPGIGAWTADIYLLTALGRADVFPAGDRALQLAAQHLFNMAEAPSASELAVQAVAWSPWRAVAARLMWSHYRGIRGLSQTVE
jgi:DNA-3-methyladenine glycosylase II